MAGAFIGDTLWLGFTCLSLIEANRLPPLLFKGLAIVCGSYIIYLAYKIYQGAKSENKATTFKRPFMDGLMLGILHPKSYAAFLAIFSALALEHMGDVTWKDFPVIFFFGALGFIASYATVLLFAGFKVVKDFYNKNFKNLSYLFALVFVYFGLSLIIGIF